MVSERTIYYSLRCALCNVDFNPLVATSPGELIAPDFDTIAEQVGICNADKLKDFYWEHCAHGLVTIELP